MLTDVIVQIKGGGELLQISQSENKSELCQTHKQMERQCEYIIFIEKHLKTYLLLCYYMQGVKSTVLVGAFPSIWHSDARRWWTNVLISLKNIKKHVYCFFSTTSGPLRVSARNCANSF